MYLDRPVDVTTPIQWGSEQAELFADIGRRLVSVTAPKTAFDVLVKLAVENVAGAEEAGITQYRNQNFVTTAATGEDVVAVDRIQYELRSGPCVDAIEEDTVFRAEDLATDARWPEFGRLASERNGIRSMLSFRLFLEDDSSTVAALNMYATRPGAFGEDSYLVGLMLASHGALAVTSALAREKVANLERALISSRTIGTAIGILMAQSKITSDHAFDLLRLASQHLHRKLADIAADVVDTGALPEMRASRSDEASAG